MYKHLLFLFFGMILFCACSSESNSEKNGVPTEKGARKIVDEWFEERKESVGGTTYEPESFKILSVTGNKEKIEIKFNGMD